MSERTAQNWDAQNQVALRRLMRTVEANSQSLELLIAVCDDRNLQAKVIEQYETELREKGIEPFRVRLNPKEPSLRRSVAALVDTAPGLRSGEPAVVTVLNAEALLGVTLGEEKSEQDRFFFSLQWQREALLRCGVAGVRGVPEGIATRSGQQAPDFWSWRGGVFEFKADEGLGKVVGSLSSRIVAFDDKRDQQAGRSVERLLLQIRELEETSPESALLITLYNDLGEVYKGCYAYGEALVWYEKALALAEKKGSLDGQARSLLNIGDALRFSGRPADSIRYYQQSLEITKEIGDRNGEAASLGSLGIANSYLSQYQQAIDFHQQSLEIKREIGDHNGAAASLGNLGIAHKNLGQYQQAIDSYQQSLEINRETGNRKGEANALGGLGNAYYALNQYWRAIDYYQQWLEIALENDDYKGEDTSLGGQGTA
ncbi:MAG: tetratricopeptide repeat protein, partial [Phormidesmis sp.]